MKSTLVFIISTYIISIFFLILTFEIPGREEVSTVTGPATWPFALIIFILALNTLMLIMFLMKRNKEKNIQVTDISEEEASDMEETEGNEDSQKNYKVYILFGLLLVYVMLLQFFGFIVSMVVFFPLCSILFGMRNKLVIFVSTLSATFVVYGVFAYLLKIPLP